MDYEQAIDKLCALSRTNYRSPYGAFDWPATLDDDVWCMAPELISIHGTAQYEALTEPQRKRLSRYEAANFFSVSVDGEKSFIEQLARMLYQPRLRDVTPYLLHFLDEENKHLVYFGEFCMRYVGRVYPSRAVVRPEKTGPHAEQDVLFFATVLAFEQMTDFLNTKMGTDERLHPIAKQINLAHHLDESRHIAFGRLVVKELFEKNRAQLSPDVRDRMQAFLLGFMRVVWGEFFNPDVYQDAGLEDAYDLRDVAMATPQSAQRWEAVTASTRQFFCNIGLWTE